MIRLRPLLRRRRFSMLPAMAGLVLSGACIVLLYGRQAGVKRELAQRTAVAANQLASALGYPLSTGRDDIVKRLAEDAMESPGLAGVLVRRREKDTVAGAMIVSRVRDPEWNPVDGVPSPNAGDLVERRPIVYDTQVVGSLEVIGGMHRPETWLRPVEVWLAGLLVVLDVVFVWATFRDFSDEQAISEKHRSAEESAARLAAIVESSDDAIVSKRMDGTIVTWNRGAERLFGYSAEEAAGKSMLVLFPPDRIHEEEHILSCVARGRTVEHFDTIRVTRDGRHIHVSVTISPMRNPAGVVIGASTIARDITERKRAENELQSREERFRQLIENASDIIAVINAAGVLRFVSPSVRRSLGYEPEELLNRNAFEFIDPGDAARTRAALDELALNPSVSVRAEFRFRHGDGSWRILQSIGRALPGQPAEGAIVVNSRDITESRSLEEQFRQSQKLEGIGQLAGGVAHDFNNILGAIMMQAELVELEAGLPPVALEGLREIRLASERAASLTRQLLLFSRKQVMQPRHVDLNEVVRGLSKMLQRIIGEDVRMHLDLEPAPLVVNADAGMMEQVLMNLSVNARDAMPEGGQLAISTSLVVLDKAVADRQMEASPGRYARLRVSDTGAGIPAEILPRIFEPFFTTKPAGKGTGLGLATTFGIVRQHKGWIRVESDVGTGTRFEVFLPIVESEATAESGPESKMRPRGGDEAILLVEDDPFVRALTRSLLERFGYRVVEAANGVEALRLWSSRPAPIALVLTDLVMPGGVSGLELARQLSQRDSGLKFIFTSGYSAEIAGRSLDWRYDGNFIQKPCPPELLLATIRRCLD